MIVKNSPEISVLLSTYNNESKIESSVKSILSQSYNDFELLIINDASDDRTLKKIKQFDDKRIRLFENKSNIGLTKSLNILLGKARGKYIARQDADDVSLKERFKIQKNYLVTKKLQFCSTRAMSIGGNKKIPGLSFHLPDKLLFKYKNPHIHGTIFLEKTILDVVGGYDENFYFAQDFKLYQDLLRKNIKLARLSDVLYLLNTSNNISTNKKIEQKYYFECAKNNLIPKVK